MASPARARIVRQPSETGAADRSAPFSAMLQAASVEFLSALQLLAERARFLTGADGAGIAIKENGEFVYRAAAGKTFETGTRADRSKAPIARCLAATEPSLVSAHTSQGQTAKVAIPIMRYGEVAGIFELHASRAEFPEGDLRALRKLADLASTAIDHLHAAHDAHPQVIEVQHAVAPETSASLSWHAEGASEPTVQANSSSTSNPEPLNVHTCHSCGFPVSEGRQLCVECELKPDAPRLPSPQMLVPENDSSWIETHGYTLASVFITAIVIAIIYWLR